MNASAVAFKNAVEQRRPVELNIVGTIPFWLSGRLFRTGPGTYQIPTKADPAKVVEIQHWFDGLAMNHCFDIAPGGKRVLYSSRKASDDYEARIAESGAVKDFTFGQRDICQTMFRKFFAAFQPTSPAGLQSPSSFNVSVTLTPNMPGWQNAGVELPTGEREGRPHYIVAGTDANLLQVINPDTLEPVAIAGYEKIDPRLDGQLAAAHSFYDKDTGDYFNYTLKLGPSSVYKVFRISATGDVKILAEIKDAPASYVHSFGVTQKYLILSVWQAHITKLGISILLNRNVAGSIDNKWDSKADTIMYVIDRKNGGVVSKFKTRPFFCFHHLNAFDDADDIILDLAIYEDNSVIDLFYLERLRNLSANEPLRLACARRFRLKDICGGNSRKAREAEVIFTLPQAACIELPTINPMHTRQRYRYAYGISNSSGTQDNFSDQLIKVDMESPDIEHATWSLPGYTPSEPIFVPGPGATAEDDGILLSVVLDAPHARSMLVIIEAKSMTEIARAEMAHVYPIGFHGMWSSANGELK